MIKNAIQFLPQKASLSKSLLLIFHPLFSKALRRTPTPLTQKEKLHLDSRRLLPYLDGRVSGTCHISVAPPSVLRLALSPDPSPSRVPYRVTGERCR